MTKRQRPKPRTNKLSTPEPRAPARPIVIKSHLRRYGKEPRCLPSQ